MTGFGASILLGWCIDEDMRGVLELGAKVRKESERGVSRQEGIYTHAGALCPHDGTQSRLTREVITGR